MLKRQVYLSRVLRNMRDFRNSIDLTQPTAADIHGRTHMHQKALLFVVEFGWCAFEHAHMVAHDNKKQNLHFKLPNMSYQKVKKNVFIG